MNAYGIVVIGRNEGDRLRRCLMSIRSADSPVVYVDSDSTDGSPSLARSLGADVVELDLTIPFTAARARNAGFDRLVLRFPEIQFVQFVDGDCEMLPGWLDEAVKALTLHREFAMICGRLRERFPEASIYHRLSDMEWDAPAGETRACGGIHMARTTAFEAAGRFDPAIIAGEEPELCVRLRRLGWKIWRLDADMAVHDAAITRFGQWWKRAVRSGHSYAEGAWMHGRSPERHAVREILSILFWSLGLPLLATAAAWINLRLGLLMLLGYPLLWWRIAYGQRRTGRSWRNAGLYATFTVIGKFAEAIGAWRFHWSRLFSARREIIDYKTPAEREQKRSS